MLNVGCVMLMLKGFSPVILCLSDDPVRLSLCLFLYTCFFLCSHANWLVTYELYIIRVLFFAINQMGGKNIIQGGKDNEKRHMKVKNRNSINNYLEDCMHLISSMDMGPCKRAQSIQR